MRATGGGGEGWRAAVPRVGAGSRRAICTGINGGGGAIGTRRVSLAALEAAQSAEANSVFVGVPGWQLLRRKPEALISLAGSNVLVLMTMVEGFSGLNVVIASLAQPYAMPRRPSDTPRCIRKDGQQ